MRRRDLLAGLGGLVGAAGLAGCLNRSDAPVVELSPSPPPSPSGPSPTPEPTDSGDHPVTPTETEFGVVDRSCGEGHNAASVTFEEDAVFVQGVIGGRDTCDTARLAEAGLHLDVLTVVVEVVDEPVDGTPVCGQCLTDITYHVRAAGLRGGPARVRVVHETADGRETVAVADRR